MATSKYRNSLSETMGFLGAVLSCKPIQNHFQKHNVKHIPGWVEHMFFLNTCLFSAMMHDGMVQLHCKKNRRSICRWKLERPLSRKTSLHPPSKERVVRLAKKINHQKIRHEKQKIIPKL
jgi:hypothetical protein